MPQATFAFFECYLKALSQAFEIKHAPKETIHLKTLDFKLNIKFIKKIQLLMSCLT